MPFNRHLLSPQLISALVAISHLSSSDDDASPEVQQLATVRW
jgi:hypothetical protein